MRRLYVIVSILIVIGGGKCLAGQADLFIYDAVTIENQMTQLNKLEGYILDNPGTTLDQMATNGNTLFSDTFGNPGFNQINEKTLGIPGFLWGCTIGWVGILVVYLNGNDPHEVKQATIGCIVEGVMVGGCYLGFWLIYGATLFSYLNSY